MTQDMGNNIARHISTQKGRLRFSRWEPRVPMVGTSRSHGGNKSFPWWELTRNYVSNLTRGLSPCEVTRLVVSLLLLLVVGVNNAWGQTDYSGTYYIANKGKADSYGNVAYSSTSTTNYYMCPATDYYNGDMEMPFITTFQTNKDKNSIWRIEKKSGENFYYIIHNATGKYVKINDSFSEYGGNNANRKRFHLETKPQTLTNDFLFEFIPYEDNYNIRPKILSTLTSGHRFLTPSGGNRPTYFPFQEGTFLGFLGIYNSASDAGSIWILDSASETCATPVISYNGTTISISSETGTTVKYTIDGSDPATNGTTYSAAFSATGVKKVRAIATKTGCEDSGEAELYPYGTSHLYYIKSIDASNAFYLVPPMDESSATDTCVTTSNVPSHKMAWHFELAESANNVNYYYIVNEGNSTKKYLYFSGVRSQSNNALTMKSTNNDDGKRDQFVLIPSSLGFFMIPRTLFGSITENKGMCINRKGGNNNTNNLEMTTPDMLASNTNFYCVWEIVPCPDTPKNMFDDSFASTTDHVKYCIVKNANADTYHVLPAATDGGNATANTSADKQEWFFMPVDDSDPWTPYYHIINGKTGEYLYFNGEAGADNTFFTSSSMEGNEDKYKFVVVKGANTTTNYLGSYNIIPKALKDQANQENNSLNRNNKILRTQNSRANTASLWKLEQSPFHCTAPDVTYDNATDKVVISSPQEVGIYFTTNGANDDVIPSSSTHYTQALEIGSSTQIIRAVCARSGDGTDNSNVVKIIFNPTITLSDASVTYDGSGHQPTISSVEFNSTDITGECTFAKYLDAEGNEVTECKNAGVYKVVITDAEGGDYYVYGSTTFTINPITGLIVTPSDGQSKEYGDPDPVLTYTCSGTPLFAGDELTGALSRDEGEIVGGTYAIKQGALGNTNYDISFTTGKTFTITQKSLGSGSTPAPNITCDVTETGGTHSIVVKQCGNDLTLDADYTKEGEDDGDKYYQVEVAGMGNYTGGFNVKLAKIQLSKLSGSSAPGGAALFVSDSGDGNFVVPDNMTAYIVTGINGNTLVTEQLNNIPEHVPVLLVSTIDANGFLVNTTTGTAPSGTNLLEVKANDWENIPAATIYLLYNGEFVLNAAGTLPAGKIYLPKAAIVDGGAPSPARLFIMWDEPTGIENYQLSTLNSQLSTGTWYALDGRKLSGIPTQKGIYIVNGKKVIIK